LISFQFGTVRLICCSEKENPAFIAEAEVVEEDTWQLMAADIAAQETDEHPIRLMTSLIDQKPLTPGEVIIRDKQWRAVIFDLDADPPCTPEWVRKALQHIRQLVVDNAISSISLSLPGIRYGCLEWQISINLVLTELIQVSNQISLDVCLYIPANYLTCVTRELEKHRNVKQ
jgi:hypothetical protein